jgi:hypothetical protein
MPTAAAPISAVASQPTAFNGPGSSNSPITVFRLDRIIISMTGTAMTPLITALQNSALIKLRARLGIGGDAAGIVVGRAGDQTWTQNLRKLGPFRLLYVIQGVGRLEADLGWR